MQVFGRKKVNEKIVISFQRLSGPLRYVVLLAADADADQRHRAAVGSVFPSIAVADYLVDGLLRRVVVFQLHNVDGPWHEQRKVAAATGRRLLGTHVGSERGEQRVE